MGSGMRFLKVLIIAMGGGDRVGDDGADGADRAAAWRRGGRRRAGCASVLLDEPAGTRIAGIAAVGDRLAVQLQGGGADRVVLLDPHTGAVVGRIGLRAGAP